MVPGYPPDCSGCRRYFITSRKCVYKYICWNWRFIFRNIRLIVIIIWVIISPVISFLTTILGDLFQDSQSIQELGDSLQKLNAMMRGLGDKISDLIGKSGIGNLVSRWAPTVKTIILISVIVLFILGIILWMTIKLWKDRERRLVGDEEKSIIQSGNILQSILEVWPKSSRFSGIGSTLLTNLNKE